MIAPRKKCSELIQRFQSWQQAVERSRRIIERMHSDDPPSRREIEESFEAVREARSTYREFAEKTVISPYIRESVCIRDGLIYSSMARYQSSRRPMVNIEDGFIVSVAISDDISKNYISAQKALEQATNLEKLIDLNVRGTKITKIPTSLSKLEKLNCRYCRQLKDIPPSLEKLREIDCAGCGEVETIPNSLISLRKITCERSGVKTIPDKLPNLVSLEAAGSTLKTLPDELPDTLHTINISSTPAAEKEAVRKRLKNFKENNPRAEVTF